MHTFSRKSVGRWIDNAHDSKLVVNALDMAVKNRQPAVGRIIHADHGVQFISWAVTNKIRAKALIHPFGTVGDCDNNPIDKSPFRLVASVRGSRTPARASGRRSSRWATRRLWVLWRA